MLIIAVLPILIPTLSRGDSTNLDCFSDYHNNDLMFWNINDTRENMIFYNFYY